MIFFTVGRMPVIKSNVKAIQMLLPTSGDTGDEFLRRDAGLLSCDHDRRAVGIIGADEMHLMALHALEANPDIGLNIFHDVADMESRICIRQSGGNK